MIVHVHEGMWGANRERTTKKDSKKEKRQGPGRKKAGELLGQFQFMQVELRWNPTWAPWATHFHVNGPCMD